MLYNNALHYLSLAVLLALFSQPAPAQEPDTTAETNAAPAVEFQQALDDYKEALRNIEGLRNEFQTAEADRREAINAQLGEIVADAKVKVDRMNDTALAAYKADPGGDQEITDLLMAMAEYMAIGHRAIDPATGAPAADDFKLGGDFQGGDNPEGALPIIQALVEGNHEDKRLLTWGGACAVFLNDYDLAEDYLNRANKAGQFADLPEFPEPTTNPEVAYRWKAREYFTKLEPMRKMWEEEQKIREAEAAADDLPRVKFTTSQGEIVVELYENEAPTATANMISLVKSGFYDDVVFHRVLPHFMAQGGDPKGTGTGGPGYNIKCECHQDNARNHFRGTLSMAHAGRDTGGSQFFLTFVPTDMLNGRHTAFGRVIEGMDVLAKIQRINPQAQAPFPEPNKIVKAEVLRDRGHDYEFEKLPER